MPSAKKTAIVSLLEPSAKATNVWHLFLLATFGMFAWAFFITEKAHHRALYSFEETIVCVANI